MWSLLANLFNPQPTPRIKLEGEQLLCAQRRYIEKFDKLVQADYGLTVEAIKLSVDYGKMTVTYLMIGNAGGLVALLTIHTAIHDVNQIWIAQQLWIAVAFVFGAAFAGAVCAMGYLGFFINAGQRWIAASNNDWWIKEAELGLDAEWVMTVTETNNAAVQRARRWAKHTTVASMAFAFLSAAAWTVGVVCLLLSVVATLGPAA